LRHVIEDNVRRVRSQGAERGTGLGEALDLVDQITGESGRVGRNELQQLAGIDAIDDDDGRLSTRPGRSR
jgi:hypothetical protein